MVWVKRFKKILDWFLVKLQRIITFALVIRITIILYGFGVAGLQTQILQKMPFSTFQQCFLWFFFIFFTFEKLSKILVLWVLIWFFWCFCLTTQRNILPIFKSFEGRLSILVVIPFVMPISLQLVLFGAWLRETQVNYNHLTLRLIGHSTEEVGILGIHLCMLNIDEGLTPTKDGGKCLRRLSMFWKEVHQSFIPFICVCYFWFPKLT